MRLNPDNIGGITEQQRLAIRQIMNGKAVDLDMVSDLSPEVREKIYGILKHVESQPKPVSPDKIRIVQEGLRERRERGQNG